MSSKFIAYLFFVTAIITTLHSSAPLIIDDKSYFEDPNDDIPLFSKYDNFINATTKPVVIHFYATPIENNAISTMIRKIVSFFSKSSFHYIEVDAGIDDGMLTKRYRLSSFPSVVIYDLKKKPRQRYKTQDPKSGPLTDTIEKILTEHENAVWKDRMRFYGMILGILLSAVLFALGLLYLIFKPKHK